MRPSNNLEIKILSDTYCSVRIVCMKVQAHPSPGSPPEYSQDQTPLTNQGWLHPS